MADFDCSLILLYRIKEGIVKHEKKGESGKLPPAGKNRNDARASGKQERHQQPQQQHRAQHPHGAPEAGAAIRSASGRRRFSMTKSAPRRFRRRTMTAVRFPAAAVRPAATRPAAVGHHAISTHVVWHLLIGNLLYYNRCRRILQSMRLKSRLGFGKNSLVIYPDKWLFLTACSVSSNVHSAKVLF